jgi:SAM-dependent methyltransferase
MPSNLSFPATSATGTFYTRIHAQIAVTAASALPPTVEEFRRWLRGTHASPAGAAALDAGCGVHGLNARQCREAGFGRVEAIDINPDAVAANRDIGAREGSVLDIPFPAGSFDLVVCSGVIHHTPDPAKALDELCRVLAPGGRLYLSIYAFRHSLFHALVLSWRLLAKALPFPVAHRLFRSVPAINNFVLDHAYVPVLWLYGAREMRDLLRHRGLEVESEFPTSFDVFARLPLGSLVSGGGLMRVFVCRRPARVDA